eukprot:839865-Amphidinium_carterae.1
MDASVLNFAAIGNTLGFSLHKILALLRTFDGWAYCLGYWLRPFTSRGWMRRHCMARCSMQPWSLLLVELDCCVRS